MDKAILKTTFKGVNKQAALTNINSLEALFLAVQSGAMAKNDALSEAEHITNAPLKKQTFGFAEEDVRDYLQKLYKAIQEYEPENK